MMRKGGETPERGEGALQGVARVLQARQGDPRRRARHRLRARRPGDLPDLGVHGQAVRQGRDLRRHHGLQPGLRRALPVDAAEADHRLALRQRLRVQQGQRADRVGPDPPGAVADDRLRGRRRGAPADAREQAPRQDRDPGRRRRGGPGQDRRGPGRDPGRGGRSDPGARSTGSSTRSGATSSPRAGCRPPSRRSTSAPSPGRSPRARRAARLHPARALPDEGPLGALLVLGRGRGEAGRAGRLLPGAILPTYWDVLGAGTAAHSSLAD